MGDPRKSLLLKVVVLFLTVTTAMASALSTTLALVAYSEGYYQEEPIPSYADTSSAQATAQDICTSMLWDPDYTLSPQWGQIAVTITDSSGQTVRQQGAVENAVDVLDAFRREGLAAAVIKMLDDMGTQLLQLYAAQLRQDVVVDLAAVGFQRPRLHIHHIIVDPDLQFVFELQFCFDVRV